MRPCVAIAAAAPHPDLPKVIARLAAVRAASPALQYGEYHQLGVQSLWLAFLRSAPEQTVAVLVNGSSAPVQLDVVLPAGATGFRRARDLLDPSAPIALDRGTLRATVPATWARILELER